MVLSPAIVPRISSHPRLSSASAATSWRFTFNKLPKYSYGFTNHYHLTVDEIPDYVISVTETDAAESGEDFLVVGTYSPEIVNLSITITIMGVLIIFYLVMLQTRAAFFDLFFYLFH